jgi:NADPH:quinone reductase-like Zn-dependent oxidoreductase
MRAVVVERLGPPDVLRVRQVPAPEPGPGELLIEVAAAGVNFPDLLVIEGSYQNIPALPFTPGKEVAGVVAALGTGTAGFAVGQRVLAQLEHGGYAERVVVPAVHAAPIPDGMSDHEAAAFGLPYLTAYFALLRRAAVRAGETVLVTGVGGAVGNAAVQLAVALGARVIAVGRTERRCVRARELGAHEAIPADPHRLRDRVRELTGGRGADVVIESVGGPVFDAVLRATAWEGRIVTLGFAGGTIPSVKAGYLLVKNIALVGLQASDYRDREPATQRRALDELLALYQEGAFTLPTTAYGFDDAPRALRALRDGGLDSRLVLVR